MKKINLTIITQENIVLADQVDAVIAPAILGEVTILPDHIPLLTKLDFGEITVINNQRRTSFAISGGMMDVAPNNRLTILADSATRSDQINLAKAEAAKKRAEEILHRQVSKKEFAIAEAELKRALIELKIGRKQRLPKMT